MPFTPSGKAAATTRSPNHFFRLTKNDPNKGARKRKTEVADSKTQAAATSTPAVHQTDSAKRSRTNAPSEISPQATKQNSKLTTSPESTLRKTSSDRLESDKKRRSDLNSFFHRLEKEVSGQEKQMHHWQILAEAIKMINDLETREAELMDASAKLRAEKLIAEAKLKILQERKKQQTPKPPIASDKSEPEVNLQEAFNALEKELSEAAKKKAQPHGPGYKR